MRRAGFGITVMALFALVAGYGLRVSREAVHEATAPLTAEAPRPTPPPAETLSFDDFFERGGPLRLSEKVKSLSGRRVRLVGFMAHMSMPPTGAFYLVPMPVRCDEAGGGTADLPPASVLVLSRAKASKEVA